MLVQFIFDLIKVPILFILWLLPTIDFEVPTDLLNTFVSSLNTLGYFLPLGTLITVLGLSIALDNFKFIWKLLTKLWNMLPFT